MLIKRFFFILLCLFILLGMFWHGLVYFVDWQLSKRSDTGVYASCDKIWSSRGLYESKDEQNTVTAFNRAFQQGAKGAEVDFYYDVKMNKFIVSHDRPTQDADGNLVYSLKEGKLLTLEDLFANVPANKHFWLDYKNLDRLSDEETQAAIERLTQVAYKYNVQDFLYIEGSNPAKLSQYTKAGFKTLFGIHPLPESNLLSGLSVNIYKVAFFFYDMTAIAMPYGDFLNPVYGNNTKEMLSYISIFLFHVPNEQTLVDNLLQEYNVNVMLVGRDESVNLFSDNACQ